MSYDPMQFEVGTSSHASARIMMGLVAATYVCGAYVAWQNLLALWFN